MLCVENLDFFMFMRKMVKSCVKKKILLALHMSDYLGRLEDGMEDADMRDDDQSSFSIY